MLETFVCAKCRAGQLDWLYFSCELLPIRGTSPKLQLKSLHIKAFDPWGGNKCLHPDVPQWLKVWKCVSSKLLPLCFVFLALESINTCFYTNRPCKKKIRSDIQSIRQHISFHEKKCILLLHSTTVLLRKYIWVCHPVFQLVDTDPGGIFQHSCSFWFESHNGAIVLKMLRASWVPSIRINHSILMSSS